jgi:hypothetical protein
MRNAIVPTISCQIPAAAIARRLLNWAEPRVASTQWNFPCFVGRAPSPDVTSRL